MEESTRARVSQHSLARILMRDGRFGGRTTNCRAAVAGQSRHDSREIATTRVSAKRCATIAEFVGSSFATRARANRSSANAGAARSTETGRNGSRGAYPCRWHRSLTTRGRCYCARQATPDPYHCDPNCCNHRSRSRRRSRCWPDRSHWQQTSRGALASNLQLLRNQVEHLGANFL
jgi:hypothetical protein